MDEVQASRANAELHNRHYDRGWELIEGLILLDGKPLRTLTWFGRRRLRKAAGHFKAAVDLNPKGWQSMCALGKIHQRLGEQETAFEWLRRAQSIDPTQSALAREAGLEALEIRDFRYAQECLERAIRTKPEDPGLVSNLAIAQLLNGAVDDAKRSISEAIARDPSDPIAPAILHAVESVQSGRASVPQNLHQLRELAG
jgi:tetratricopeptide (TPR) repeat protein